MRVSETLRKALGILLCLMMLVQCLPVRVFAADCAHTGYVNGFCVDCGIYEVPTGKGTSGEPYQIANAGQLYWFAATVNGDTSVMTDIVQNKNAWAVLIGDIDINPGYVFQADGTVTKDGATVTEGWRVWEPIGSQSVRYKGTFDGIKNAETGEGHTISGLYCGDPDRNYVGLFGYVDSGTNVQNLVVTNSYFTGKDYVGSLVGYSSSGKVINCDVTAAVASTGQYCGGVVGYSSSGNISDSSFSGSVTGTGQYVGGIAGRNSYPIRNSVNHGTVSGQSAYVGGITGYNSDEITGCYNTGNVTGAGQYVGGISGSGSDNIINCYNIGTVTSAADYVGGIVGYNSTTYKIAYCYNVGTVTGTGSYVGGIVGYGIATNSAYLDTCGAAGMGTAMPLAAFRSGEVAYRLQVNQTEQVWGQNVDREEPYDAYPVFSQDKVYPVSSGSCVTTGYSNTQSEMPAHSYVNGFCTGCGIYEIPAGKGTSGEPYQIANAGQLYWFAATVNGDASVVPGIALDQSAWAVLIGDIDINPGYVFQADGTVTKDGATVTEGWRVWEPIGTQSVRYKGAFDGIKNAETGEGHTISGLYCGDPNRDHVGLFGYVDYGTKVQNLVVTNSYFTGKDYVGSLVGYNSSGNVTNCDVTAAVASTGQYCGGLVGYSSSGNISDSSFSGSVTGTGNNVGGIVGRNISLIRNSVNHGTVSGQGSYVGGISGANSDEITGCYNTGNVTGAGSDVGGISGSANDNIINCYNIGTVTGAADYVGGIAGYISSVYKISYCYNVGTVTGTGSYVGGITGSGTAISSVYLDTCGAAGAGVVRNRDQFQSGEVAYLLQADQAEQIWGQNVDREEPYDEYPVFSQDKVYPVSSGSCVITGYSNTEREKPAHSYVNGFCTGCGIYEVPTGKGTSGEPYQIANAGQLYWFAATVNGDTSVMSDIVPNLNAWAVLIADIDINPGYVFQADGTVTKDGETVTEGWRTWTPIGTQSIRYKGAFDGIKNAETGEGHTISGLYCGDPNRDYVGLFGNADYGSKVQNLVVTNSYFTGKDYVGSLVGTSYYCNVTNCDVTAAVASTGQYCGGLVGNDNGYINNSSFSGSVTGTGQYVGGLAGRNGNTILNSVNHGTVSGQSAYVGGISGANSDEITGCYNTGSVTGAGQYVGGISGYSSDNITTCYNIGTVTGNDDVGGICGWGSSSYRISNCYNIGNVVGTGTKVGGIAGSGQVVGSFYLDTCGAAGTGEVRTLTGFQSGEVAYLLQANQTEQVWGQNVDREEPYDGYPVFSQDKIYPVSSGSCVITGYSNTQGEMPVHSYVNGFCTGCGIYEVPAGKGTSGEPYQIANAGQLYWFAATVNGDTSVMADIIRNQSAWAVLIADIDINPGYVFQADGTVTKDGATVTEGWRVWTPIGTESVRYKGTFDGIKNAETGEGHTISGLYCGDPDRDHVGLFGYIDYGTKVQNLVVTNSYFTGKNYVGSLVGYSNSGKVINCDVTAAVASTGQYCGGLVGYSSTGNISDSSFSGSVTGTGNNVGGIAGGSSYPIRNSVNHGTVSGQSANVGGIVGYNSDEITGCYNTGSVTGAGQYVGGISGYSGDNITNCYNIGTVTGAANNVGGIAGYNSTSYKISYCYNIGTVTGTGNYVGGIAGSGIVVSSVYLDTCGAAGMGMVRNRDQFQSGEVAYLLQAGQAEQIWGQNVDREEPYDEYPVFSQDKVYPVSSGSCVITGYSNTESEKPAHSYVNGFCTGCGIYEIPAGEGTSGAPYQIANAGQLYWFAATVNGDTSVMPGITINQSAWAVLIADIDINPGYVFQADGTVTKDGETVTEGWRTWTPIGTESIRYKGTFDGIKNAETGEGHTISGLYCGDPNRDHVGLFGYLDSHSKVQNLALTNSYLTGKYAVGSLVGYNYLGNVLNCDVTVAVAGTGQYCGGLAGYSIGNISDSSFGGSVTGTGDYVGGIAGSSSNPIMNSVNHGTVSGQGSYVGGITGSNNGNITNCYNIGTVTGTGTHVGGIAGSSFGGMTNCYNIGTVTGTGNYVGGITGYAMNAHKISYCYNVGTVTGTGSYVGGITGSGPASSSFYLDTCGAAGVGEAKSLTDFRSGKVAYLLQSQQTEQVWGQNLNNGQAVQDYPVFSDAVVYEVGACDGVSRAYSNSQADLTEHRWDPASCSVPETCLACGTTRGETLPHDYTDNHGSCLDCGHVCTHNWKDGSCLDCGGFSVTLKDDDICGVSMEGPAVIFQGQELQVTLKNIASQSRTDVKINSVHIGGGVEYTFDADTGILTISADKVTGPVVISASAYVSVTVNMAGGTSIDGFIVKDGVAVLEDSISTVGMDIDIAGCFEYSGYRLAGFVDAEGNNYATDQTICIAGDLQLTLIWECIHSNTKGVDNGDGTHKIVCTDPNCGQELTAKEDHSLTYTASGNTVTASCGTCNATGTVSINAADKTYDGQAGATVAKTGVLADAAITVAYTKDGSAFEGEPIDAGQYTVSVSVGGETVSVEFRIAKADPAVTAPAAKELTYNGNVQTLITAGSALGGTMMYQLEGGEWSETLPEAKTVGTYTVKYKVLGDENHNDVAEASITVTIQECAHTGGTANCVSYKVCEKCGDKYGELGEHAWTVTYSFAEDGSACSATHVCGNDATHNVTIEATIKSEITKPATCEAKGETTYTATFTEDWAETQTKTLENVASLGHAWTDGVCGTCGEVCGHESYTDGVCDACGKLATYTVSIKDATKYGVRIVSVNGVPVAEGETPTIEHGKNLTIVLENVASETRDEVKIGTLYVGGTFDSILDKTTNTITIAGSKITGNIEFKAYAYVTITIDIAGGTSVSSKCVVENGVATVVDKWSHTGIDGIIPNTYFEWTGHTLEAIVDEDGNNYTRFAPFGDLHLVAVWSCNTMNDATCDDPKTCPVCGKTEGEPLGHDWTDATCTDPKTCSVCGETEGEALGHDWTDGVCGSCGIVCEHTNYTDGACDVCGKLATYTVSLYADDTYGTYGVRIVSINGVPVAEGVTPTVEHGKDLVIVLENIASETRDDIWLGMVCIGGAPYLADEFETAENNTVIIPGDVVTGDIEIDAFAQLTITVDMAGGSVNSNHAHMFTVENGIATMTDAWANVGRDLTYARAFTWEGHTLVSFVDQDGNTYDAASDPRVYAYADLHMTLVWKCDTMSDATCDAPKTCPVCGKTEGEALGHDWTVTYNFAEDGSACSATHVCGNDATHNVTIEATIESEITKPATCEGKGETTYTATFTEDWAETQTKTLEDVAKLDHAWTVTYNFAEDGSACTATHVCGNDATHNVTIEASIKSEITKPATCEGMGETTYTATFTEDWAEVQTLVVENVESLGHAYGKPVIVWNEDNTASATVICANDNTHVVELEVTVTSTSTAGDCQTLATTTYTATVEYEGETFTDTKVVEGELGDHTGDADKDHNCDLCGAELSKCADADKNHKCDVCGEVLTECVDENKDHICDICGAELEKPTAPEYNEVIRIFGSNRWNTALKVADEMKANLCVEKFDAIIIASGADFADALAGSYLSAVKNAPILFAWGNGGKYEYLDADNIAYIKANLAEGGIVYILGGKNAVPELYEAGLEGYQVKRLGGANRFETNILILKEAGIEPGAEILVCTSTNFADSLSASATGKPILLVWNESGALYGNQPDFLAELEEKNCKFTILGGESAVSAKLEDTIKAYGEVTRLAGKNRMETSVLVAQKYFDAPETAVVAYAWNYPDGLCGGSLAFSMGAPLILTMTGYETEAVDYMKTAGIEIGLVLGGESLVSDEIVRAIFAMDAEDEIIVK